MACLVGRQRATGFQRERPRLSGQTPGFSIGLERGFAFGLCDLVHSEHLQ